MTVAASTDTPPTARWVTHRYAPKRGWLEDTLAPDLLDAEVFHRLVRAEQRRALQPAQFGRTVTHVPTSGR